jgi:hypothetical protein
MTKKLQPIAPLLVACLAAALAYAEWKRVTSENCTRNEL